jgi:hypothetical protein
MIGSSRRRRWRGIGRRRLVFFVYLFFFPFFFLMSRLLTARALSQFKLGYPELADKMMIELHILTGLWGKGDTNTRFEISNGTHTQMTSMEKLYPGDTNGRIFMACQKAQGMRKGGDDDDE